jgi:uncharacterized protein with ParB-like and HNH nuclease domain/predicted transport protein
MKAQESQFLPFLNGKKQFIIPIYQRTYSWHRDQCSQIWQDIVRAGNDQTMPGHFLGSIVYIQQGVILFGNVPQFLLIDGQQRLTTLVLLLTALAETPQKEEGLVKPEFKKEIYDSYLVNAFGKDEQRYKLLLTQSDSDLLKQIIDHPEKVSLLKTASPLVDNFLFFQEQLHLHQTELNIILQGLNKLFIVEISLNKENDNPQLIFESLNSTGMDLSQADLIRNYVLMGLDNDEQSRLYKEYWYPIEQKFRYTGTGDSFDRFMRDYLTLKQGTIPNIDKVYTTFKSYHRVISYKTTIQKIIEDIALYAEYFANMAFLHEEDPAIKQAMLDINALKVDVVYPFFLEIYDDYKHARLSKKDLLSLLRLIESYVFRRAICGIPTNGLNKMFSTLANEIDKTHYLESAQSTLMSKSGGSRFPGNDEFKSALVAKDIYNYPRRNYLLRKLENYERKELISVENCTIEHILPQNSRLSDEWRKELGTDWKEVQGKFLHTIGNLTLTAYNSALSDRPFSEKRTIDGGFDRSPLRLNQTGVAHVSCWNQAAIEQRAQLLAELACKVWALPPFSKSLNKSSIRIGRKPPLAEITGPAQHPLAGFVPEGFRVIQTTEKRFYLFRKVDNEWIQYGNGKNSWFTVSWEYVRAWIQAKQQKNEMPLGVGGEKILAVESSLKKEDAIGTDYLVLESADKSYSIADHPQLQGNMLIIFNELRKRLLNLSVAVREEFKKHYIAYKLTTNFADIEPQKMALYVYLNMPFEEIDDPLGLCEDLTRVGHHANGNIRIRLIGMHQLENVMYLIQQSFERQNTDEAVA